MTMTCVERRGSRSRPDQGTGRFDSELGPQDGQVTARLGSIILVARRPGS